jgi:hypothetical protein
MFAATVLNSNRAVIGTDGFESPAPSRVPSCPGLIFASGGLLGWWRRRHRGLKIKTTKEEPP